MKTQSHPAFWALLLALATAFSVLAAQMPQADGSSIPLFSRPWTDKAAEEKHEVNLLLTGDIMLDRYIATLRERALADQDSSNDLFPFTHMPEVLDAVETSLNVDALDLVLANLEGPITDSTYKNNGTAMVFNFKPSVADLLKTVGFTTVNMANNHTLDMGKTGPQQTHDYLAAVGIDAFGHPDTPNGDYSFLSYDLNGIKVGFLGFNDAVQHLDKEAALAKIKEVKPEVDVLILAVHWGTEYLKEAPDSIVDLGHQFVDAGVDFVWGTHPHVIENSELYNGKYIYYSLGNFVFDQYWSKATQEGLVLGLKIEENSDGTYTFTPKEILVDLVNQGEPKPRE